MTPRPPARCAALAAGLLAAGLVGAGLLGACEPPNEGPAASSTASSATRAAAPGVPPVSSDPSDPVSTAGAPAGSSSGAPPGAGPPFVAAATWVRGSGGRSLHVVPTAAGRVAQGAGDAAEAWGEVLRFAPDADQPGMQSQFDCHWTYARLVQPDKPSWNLEPWRPVVSEQQLVDARCNPGGPESAEG